MVGYVVRCSNTVPPTTLPASRSQVKYWTTFNEPNFYCMYFNALLIQANEVRKEDVDLQRCLHHFVLGHMKAYHTYRDKYAASQQGSCLLCHRGGMPLASRWPAAGCCPSRSNPSQSQA